MASGFLIDSIKLYWLVLYGLKSAWDEMFFLCEKDELSILLRARAVPEKILCKSPALNAKAVGQKRLPP